MNEPCAYRGCVDNAGQSQMFCKHHDDDVFSRAYAAIRDVLSVGSAIYIGRTGFPERRLLEHALAERDHLLLLHWAASWPEAEEFETRLIESCSHLNRIENETTESAGRFTSPWNAIYVSFRLKHRVHALPGTQEVTRLHWRLRTWPTQTLPCPVVLLRTPLDHESSAAELERWQSTHHSRHRRRTTHPS